MVERAAPFLRYRRALALYRETSREAWASMTETDLLAPVDAAILRVVREGPLGATSAEIEAATGLKHQTVSAQIRHMALAGLLVETGVRRRNAGGRYCLVWMLPLREAGEVEAAPMPTEQGGLF